MLDHYGNSHGKSKKCAETAVLQTSISRIALVATIFVPPFALVALEKARLMPKHRVPKFTVEFSLLALELYFAVPLGLAMYSRYGTIAATDLEPEFQGLRDVHGNEIREFLFNKGL